MLHRDLPRVGSVQQIRPPQRPQDPALTREGGSSAPGPSARRHPPRPLQVGRTQCLPDQTFAASPERCSTPRVQPTKSLPCDPSLPGPPLAPCSSSPQIQEDGTALQGGQWNCPCLIHFIYYYYYLQALVKTTQPSSSAPLNYLSRTSGTAIAESKQRSISRVTTLLCSGTAVVEPAPYRSEFNWTLHSLPPHTPLTHSVYVVRLGTLRRHIMVFFPTSKHSV